MKIQIVSGFLGAGKTTFLNKYLPLLKGKTAVIENEFGSVGIDGELIDFGIPVREIYSGCICCSLTKEFERGIVQLNDCFKPDYIIIEPSGVSKLSEVLTVCKSVRDTHGIDFELAGSIVMVEGPSFEEYIEDFGAFYLDQIKYADVIFITKTEEMSDENVIALISSLRGYNESASIISEDFRNLEDDDLFEICSAFHTDKDGDCSTKNITFESIVIGSPVIADSGKLKELFSDKNKFGYILRLKGVYTDDIGKRFLINYTPASQSIEEISGDLKDRLVIIGTGLNRIKLKGYFTKKNNLKSLKGVSGVLNDRD